MTQPRPIHRVWVEKETFIEAFEAAFAADVDADFAVFIPPSEHPLRLPVLEELVRIDLEHHWLRGEPRWLEHYFRRFPELIETSAVVRTLAFEEHRLRRQAGQSVQAAEYRERFGIDPSRDINDDLPDSNVSAGTPRPKLDRFAQLIAALPRVGDVFLGHRLDAELGKGAFGQVFLATTTRGGRRVALKVAPLVGGEPPLLARLRHPHIVPIRAVLQTGMFQAVVMPYRGAVTLHHAQRQFASADLPTNGAALFDVVRPGLPRSEDRSPLRERLGATSYRDAAIWLAARLADGLAHAHHRGLLHRDLKPANVLIADDATPMLLDFNLATAIPRGPAAIGPSPGGTLPYMAPEQIDHFLGNPRVIDARADLYGLGVILFQLLTGRMPYSSPRDFSQARIVSTLLRRLRPAPRVQSFNPELTADVDALVGRLLQADPDLRPASAAEVRDQLSALTPHLPHRAVSLGRRFANWFNWMR